MSPPASSPRRTLPAASFDGEELAHRRLLKIAQDTENCTEVYGDREHDEYGNVRELCPKRQPPEECEYLLRDAFQFCCHCGKGNGVL